MGLSGFYPPCSGWSSIPPPRDSLGDALASSTQSPHHPGHRSSLLRTQLVIVHPVGGFLLLLGRPVSLRMLRLGPCLPLHCSLSPLPLCSPFALGAAAPVLTLFPPPLLPRPSDLRASSRSPGRWCLVPPTLYLSGSLTPLTLAGPGPGATLQPTVLPPALFSKGPGPQRVSGADRWRCHRYKMFALLEIAKGKAARTYYVSCKPSA